MSGGVRVCAIYAKKLTEMGHKVSIVTTKKNYLPFKSQLKRILKGRGWLSREAQTQNHFSNMGIPIQYGSTEKYLSDDDLPDADVVIATWWETAVWVNNLSLVKGKKFYFIQGIDYVNESVSREAVEATYQFNFQIITIANWIKELLITRHGINNIPIIPNSVEHTIFYASKRSIRAHASIGFLFSEAECKGVPVALQVIDELRLKLPKLAVFSFGSSVPQKITLPNYVSLTISPEQDEIRNIYQQCDVWLCCSLSEGFGLTLIEAMACGTPVEDIIEHNENGFLCDINDVDNLVDSVMTLLNGGNVMWQYFSLNAMTYAKSYSWDQAAQKFESVLLESK